MKKIVLFLCLLSTVSYSQEYLKGVISEEIDGEEVELLGANVFWLDTQVGTVTDAFGRFKIPYKQEYKKLVISYVGYQTDTLDIDTNSELIYHKLKSTGTLDEVVVKNRTKATTRSFLEAQNVINVSSAELLKAACCNLSESFETNPSIDVNFTDAITGVHQIRMLGLTGKYTLITTENIPLIRGAAQSYGLSFVPGTWVESIQITKGAGSVVNGFESIAGQINTELVKPNTDKPVFVNVYRALAGRREVNVHLNKKLSDKWSAGFYFHENNRNRKNDRNDDDFLDIPLAQQINVMNRWQYTDAQKGCVGFLNLNYLKDDKQVGQKGFVPDRDRGNTQVWGGQVDTERFAVSGKLGYVFPEIPYQSMGLQLSYSDHKQNSYFGLRDYNIRHKSGYASALFNSIISDSRHKFKTGITATYDDYDELVEVTNYERTEQSVGGFFEYAFDNLSNLSITAGLRADSHNLLGNFITPRLHGRFTPWEKGALRFSAGRGKRSANIFIENQALFSTSRSIFILNDGGDIYGLDPEIAWNYGVSFLQGFKLFDRRGDITFDFYRTDFENQVVVDWEDPNQIRFYNLEGESFANSFQVELNYSPFEGFDVRTAYKLYDVQTDYAFGRLEKPLTPKHRVFANASYETYLNEDTGSQWKFDATYNWLSKQRFASTSANDSEFRVGEFSPSLGTLNIQVTKVFSPRFEVYLGGENVFDVRQDNPILDAENPFGSNFDSTFVYGPIFGSNYYAGLRYNIPAQ